MAVSLNAMIKHLSILTVAIIWSTIGCGDIHGQVANKAEGCQGLATVPSPPPKMTEKIRGEFLEDGTLIQDIFLQSPDWKPIRAFVVGPYKPEPNGGAVLFLHWLGAPPDSDRTEFFDDAMALAKTNVTSLLVDTPWADPEWFSNRKLQDDRDETLHYVSTLEGQLKYLLQRAKADPAKVALVGHDFGAMYGALLIKNDNAIRHAVVMAGVPDFADWFLLGQKLSNSEQEKYRKGLSDLAPSRHLRCSSVDVLFQFADSDKFVNSKQASEFVDGAPGEKQVLHYPGGHALQHESKKDRLTWLQERVGTAAK